ncbi:hypothetical protein RXV95_05420 [Novosphingobium sp. ZN18A2]|uniref:hypothetical protein n=1 Tax=Novosphingobium sp. ZN18A2 TaxID=3079861 RepID=UPI0030D34FE0
MMFWKPRHPRPAASPGTQAVRASDPRRIWIEEVMGTALPARGPRREAAIAALLADGGRATWNALRTTH